MGEKVDMKIGRKYLLVLFLCFVFCYLTTDLLVEARTINIEETGSLTINKYMNPIINVENNLENIYEGNGLLDPTFSELSKPQSGVEFSIYGRLTAEEMDSLVSEESLEEETYTPNQIKVHDFIKNKDPVFTGETNDDGQLYWANIPINTDNIADNFYLVVETHAGNQQSLTQNPAAPIIVNVPVTNPIKGEKEKNYLYDVNIYMKNYAQLEPELEKTIDKSSHSYGELVNYQLKVTNLDSDVSSFKLLEVIDELDSSLSFFELGYPGYLSDTINISGNVLPEKSVTFYNGTTKKISTLEPNVDYEVQTPEKNSTGELRWKLTQTGLNKISDIQIEDGSFINLMYTAISNEKSQSQKLIPNKAKINYLNQFDYGSGSLIDSGIEVAEKPSEVVNTLFDQANFEKKDKDDLTKGLTGAKFLVKNESSESVTSYSGINQKQPVTYAAGTPLYGIIENSKLVGWTPNWQEAINNKWYLTSKDNGAFSIDGLGLTQKIHYRNMYLFGVIDIANVNGTQLPYVSHYETVLADKRSANTSSETIKAEIESVLTEHPGDSTSKGSWFFYKESEVDPTIYSLPIDEMIDYTEPTLNQYSLIEIEAPKDYVSLEDESKISNQLSRSLDFGKVNNNNLFDANKNVTSPFSNELSFETNLLNGKKASNVITNKKKGFFPQTGETLTFAMVIIGTLMVLVTFYYRFKKNADNKEGEIR